MASWQQIVVALVFLTRLPLGRLLPLRVMPLAECAWAFPLAGAAVGALAAIPLLLDGSSILMAGLSLTISIWLTGALHEDGLADFADAAGGQDREARLQIMRDSRIGSYGVMALILTSALRIAALGLVGPAVLIAATAGGRLGIVLTMAALPPAREDGLSHGAGLPGWRQVAGASLIGAVLLVPSGQGALLALMGGLVATGLVIRQARVMLGGQTGDVLGSASVATETAMLIVFAMAA